MKIFIAQIQLNFNAILTKFHFNIKIHRKHILWWKKYHYGEKHKNFTTLSRFTFNSLIFSLPLKHLIFPFTTKLLTRLFVYAFLSHIVTHFPSSTGKPCFIFTTGKLGLVFIFLTFPHRHQSCESFLPFLFKFN